VPIVAATSLDEEHGVGSIDFLAILALAAVIAFLSRLPRAFSLQGCLLGFILALYGALLGWTLVWRHALAPLYLQPLAGTSVPLGLPSLGALAGALAVRLLLRRRRR
jgi:hypothetical protein